MSYSTVRVTDQERETLIALCEQEADDWEQENENVSAKRRAAYLRRLGRKIRRAKASELEAE